MIRRRKKCAFLAEGHKAGLGGDTKDGKGRTGVQCRARHRSGTESYRTRWGQRGTGRGEAGYNAMTGDIYAHIMS